VIHGKEIIANSKYAEFPDVLVTLELCRAFAQRDKRRVGESLRACARALAGKAQNQLLINTLQEMGKSQFPETQMPRIRDCIRRMEAALNKNFNTRGVVA
jgi:cytochrome c551/c552